MKKILSLVFTVLMILSCAVVVSAAKNVFPDVEEGRWSEASVSYAVSKGYMNGVGTGFQLMLQVDEIVRLYVGIVVQENQSVATAFLDAPVAGKR